MKNNLRKYNQEILYRDLPFEMGELMEGSRTVSLAFSSETPVSRFFGTEILEHTPEAVQLERLNNGGALLVNHDSDDQVGVVESAQIDSDRIGRAIVRFGNSERAEEIFQDVKDGIRRLVSVGYQIHEETAENETVTATRWEPLELSIVSIPADYKKAGVGRSIEESINPQKNKIKMPETSENIEGINPEQIRSEELSRVREIIAEGEAHKMPELARNAINEGSSLESFRGAVLEEMKKRSVKPPSAEIGLTPKEVKEFSFLRAINALANPTDRRAQEAAAFEFKASEAACKRSKQESRGIRVPSEVLSRAATVGTATAGGNTVATNLLAQNFIELLRNNTLIYDRATHMNGLVGNVAIPRHTGGATGYWVAESASPTASQPAFDQVPMSPQTLGAFTDISRKLLLQSSISIEAFVRNELAKTMALEVDRVCINGSGTAPEPRGILNTTGIGAVVGGANGLAVARDHIIDLESALSTVNADVGSLNYITNASVRGKLKKTLDGANSAAQHLWSDGEINGYKPLVTNQVPSNLTKGTSSGVCSALIFGNLSDWVVGLWGGLDLMVDQYTFSTSGTVRVVALQDLDVTVRHPESFSAMVDVLTA